MVYRSREHAIVAGAARQPKNAITIAQRMFYRTRQEKRHESSCRVFHIGRVRKAQKRPPSHRGEEMPRR